MPLIILKALGVGMIANSYGEINRVYKYLERNKSKDRAERSPRSSEYDLLCFRSKDRQLGQIKGEESLAV